MLTSAEIREAFIRYFEGLDHIRVKPASIVPANDPTLLFTNAGMNQFKDVFLGQGSREYSRAVDSQPCIRVSGKHNDLEDVGRDTTHLTLFEMLGNWSFGDYYKAEAIKWAWELLTETFQIPKEKLYVTVFREDDEAMALWKSETDIAYDRILKFDEKDNFWEMGAVGPCGPCSEIHIDLGEEYSVAGKAGGVNGEDGRFIEIWNLVFIQYERQEDGSLVPLDAQHVDTGAGLERLVAFLQGKASVYQTDLFLPLLDKITKLTGKLYSDGLDGMPHRVMADHIRTISFAISDNVMPSNDGRGYVIRRLLRRALRYATTYGVTEPILYKLVEPLCQTMGAYYSNLSQRKEFIEQIVEAEEKAFLRTLESGEAVFQTLAKQTKNSGLSCLSGELVFKLYDTYGFPADLTAVMAREQGLDIDLDAFEQALEKARAKSRSNAKVHHANFEDVPKGGEARLVKTPEERLCMARHHTGTHLLHEALRRELGSHVVQAGSLVDLDHLRFDFSHFKGLSAEELQSVEKLVNDKINENIAITVEQMDLDEAKAKGAMALFGEKYDQVVRVVKIGDFSFELCGGHHVSETDEIESFKILHEGAIAAGTRRIEAIAGADNIRRYLERKEAEVMLRITSKLARLKELDSTYKEPDTNGLDLASLERLDSDLHQAIKTSEKELAKAKNKQAAAAFKELDIDMKPLGDSDLVYAVVILENHDLTMLRQFSDNALNKYPNAVFILLGERDGTGSQLVRLPKPCSLPIDGNELFAKISELTGARGGGRSDMVQGGGADPHTFEKVSDVVDAYMSSFQII